MPGRPPLFAWYRVMPLVVVLIFGTISALYSYAPALLFKYLYQLDYEVYITQSATRHGVDPYLVAAVIDTESDWKPAAVSSAGAQGLMQLMPETAQNMIDLGYVDGSSYSSSNLSDPATNIEFGCAYLSYLLSYFNNSTDHAIAAYNAGMGNVEAWTSQDLSLEEAISFPETQTYLIRVNMALDRYRVLYPDSFQ